MARRHAINENFLDIADPEELQLTNETAKIHGVVAREYFEGESLEEISMKAADEIKAAMASESKPSNLPHYLAARAARIYLCDQVRKAKIKSYRVEWKPLNK